MSADEDARLDEILAQADQGVADKLEEAADLDAGLDSVIFVAEVRSTLNNL